MIQIPILGSLALGAGTILERVILKAKSMNIKLYQVATFLAIILVMTPFLFFFWKLDAQAFELKNILIFVGIVIASVIANVFVFYSLKWEKVTNLEPARILEPLFIILIAIIMSFFVDGIYQRDIKIVIPAIIAALALVFPHIKKEHFKINKFIIAAILGSFFFALELSVSGLILEFYSPVTFYFLRSAAVLILSFLIFRPSFKALNKKVSLTILITGAIWVVYRLVMYFGYANYGIVFTTLMIMLGPIVVYLLAWKFLKEKLNWKNLVSSLIIIACVLYVTLS